MAAMGDYLENKIGDAVLRGQAFPNFGTVYLALYTSGPNDADASGTEVTGAGYARVKACAGATQALTDWKSTQDDNLVSTGNTGQFKNTVTFTFGAPTASWGTITHFRIMTALNDGSVLFHGSLNSPKNVGAGDAAPSFAPGSLPIQVDN